MSSFNCGCCGALCCDTRRGYITGCQHFPADFTLEEMQLRWVHLPDTTDGPPRHILVHGKLFGRRKQRLVATVYENGTWHTWDERGVGGENSREKTVEEAKVQALCSAVMQGFVQGFR